jgi:hypothetical protein
MCHLAHNCLSIPPQALDDVMGVQGDVMVLPRPTSWWKGHNPPGYEFAKLPLVERPLLSPVESSDLSLPPAGVSIHLVGFQPHGGSN